MPSEYSTEALLDPAAYAAAYPQGSATLADINAEGRNDVADVLAMVVLLVSP